VGVGGTEGDGRLGTSLSASSRRGRAGCTELLPTAPRLTIRTYLLIIRSCAENPVGWSLLNWPFAPRQRLSCWAAGRIFTATKSQNTSRISAGEGFSPRTALCTAPWDALKRWGYLRAAGRIRRSRHERVVRHVGCTRSPEREKRSSQTLKLKRFPKSPNERPAGRCQHDTRTEGGGGMCSRMDSFVHIATAEGGG
jgi:hypothetical protein